MQNLYAYRHIDKDISSVALNKFCNHLWYLAPEAAALAFFDKNISTDTKKLMVQALKLNESSDESIKKVAILPKDVSQYMGQEIDQFIYKDSRKFFERFSISTDFLDKDPLEWEDDDGYKKGLEIVKGLKVVNDSAERGVKLMQDYNDILSRKEDDKQFILQVVSEYRRQYPDVKKSTLMKN